MKNFYGIAVAGLLMTLSTLASAQSDPWADIKANYCRNYQMQLDQVVIPMVERGMPTRSTIGYFSSETPYENKRNLQTIVEELHKRPRIVGDYIRSREFVTHCIEWVKL